MPLIDPQVYDDDAPDWMYVVVERETGVRYAQQYGGTACLQGRVQGYLRPVYNAEARRLLDDLFVRELRCTGLPLGRFREYVPRVAEAVALIRFQAAGEILDAPEAPLRLDLDRLDEADEAWLPVVTLDGPGILIWPNSD